MIISSFSSSKTFELQGFKQLIDQIAESKKTSADHIISQISSTGGPSLGHVTVRLLVYENTNTRISVFILDYGE